MADADPLVAVVAFTYGTAVVGLLLAYACRPCFHRGRRQPTHAEAALCALLPVGAIVVGVAMAVSADLPTHQPPMHDLWHAWIDRIPSGPAVHAAFHAANYLLVLAVLLGLGRSLYGLAQTQSFARALRRAATPLLVRESVAVYTLETPRLLCFSVGLRTPCICISSSLLARLSDRERDILLAHEVAHVRRRDNLLNALLVAFYTLFPLPGGRRLYEDWVRAAERACDAEAARQAEDPCDVAATLVAVVGLTRRWATPGAAHFAAVGDDIAGRVRALLALPRRGPAPARCFWLIPLLLLLAGGVGAAQPSLLHLVEAFVRH